jgi:hypothetical protein
VYHDYGGKVCVRARIGDFVYLAYFDDAGSHNKDRRFQVLSAVLIKDEYFKNTELLMGINLEDLLPPEKLNKFSEFHASELFGGYGVFEGVDQTKRFKAMEFLLKIIRSREIPVVVGAVDLLLLRTKPYGSANPMDIAFRLCLSGMEEWLARNPENSMDDDFAILIADDCSKEDRETLRTSFRELRRQIRPPDFSPGHLWHVHDAMYFGNSKDSIGLQLADSCSYFAAKHLEQDPSVAGFYDIIENSIVSHKVEPT